MIKKDNQCLGKIKYDTLEKASASSASMNKTGKKKLCAYRCDNCHGFHTGHNSRGSKLDKNRKKRKVVVDHEPGIHHLSSNETERFYKKAYQDAEDEAILKGKDNGETRD